MSQRVQNNLYIDTTIAIAEKRSKRSEKGPFSLYIGPPCPTQEMESMGPGGEGPSRSPGFASHDQCTGMQSTRHWQGTFARRLNSCNVSIFITTHYSLRFRHPSQCLSYIPRWRRGIIRRAKCLAFANEIRPTRRRIEHLTVIMGNRDDGYPAASRAQGATTRQCNQLGLVGRSERGVSE